LDIVRANIEDSSQANATRFLIIAKDYAKCVVPGSELQRSRLNVQALIFKEKQRGLLSGQALISNPTPPRTTRTGYDKSIIMFELKIRDTKALSIAMSLFSKHSVDLLSVSSYLKPALESSMPAQPLYLAELKGTRRWVGPKILDSSVEIMGRDKIWLTVVSPQGTATIQTCKRFTPSSPANARHSRYLGPST
jgi:hypothetical protein